MVAVAVVELMRTQISSAISMVQVPRQLKLEFQQQVADKAALVVADEEALMGTQELDVERMQMQQQVHPIPVVVAVEQIQRISALERVVLELLF